MSTRASRPANGEPCSLRNSRPCGTNPRAYALAIAGLCPCDEAHDGGDERPSHGSHRVAGTSRRRRSTPGAGCKRGPRRHLTNPIKRSAPCPLRTPTSPRCPHRPTSRTSIRCAGCARRPIPRSRSRIAKRPGTSARRGVARSSPATLSTTSRIRLHHARRSLPRRHRLRPASRSSTSARWTRRSCRTGPAHVRCAGWRSSRGCRSRATNATTSSMT